MDGREKNSGLELCVSSLVATTGALREIKTSYRHAALSSRDVMFTCRVSIRVIQSKQKNLEKSFYQRMSCISVISVSILVIDLILNIISSILTKLEKINNCR